MKKLLCIVLAALMCVSMAALVGCEAPDDGKYTVGICQLIQHPALDAATKGFKDALVAELGEENVTFVEGNANGEATVCSTIIGNQVSSGVDLIMANATAALQAAQAGTTTIPILGTSITEYGVALNIKDFKGTVGGNVSGTSDLAPLDKQAQMIIDLFPEAKKVALLYCSAEPNSVYQVNVVREYLENKGITCVEKKFSDATDVALVSSQAAEEADVIYIPTDNTAANCAATINGVIGDTPVIAGEAGICSGCGVATLSIEYYDLGYATGKMAAKILRGEADISTMPIEYTPEEKLAKKYNAAKCDQLGIDKAWLESLGYTAIE